jgi:hypothetical protein
MGGDFSRLRFQPGKRYAGVLAQQGRVQTDSDWNEAERIRDHRERMLVRDLLGPCAFVDRGFALTADGERLTIGAGHAWIDGLLCELAGDTDADEQPDLPSARVPTDPGSYVAYLEVWQREVTATEDESLLDPALGGADTTVRLATVTQVRFHEVTAHDPRRRPDWSLPPEATDATLAVGGGYAGTDNRLYRVEIHEDGGEPTFKWSRDNGSTTAAVRSLTATEIALARSNEPRFHDGDLLEVIDRNTILERRPGPFVQVERLDGDRLVLASGSEPVPPDLVRPIVRRWDGGRQFVRTGATDPIALDDGLEVRFEGSRFRSGDYWLIAARAGDRSLTWPDATDAADPRPPHGVEVHRCPIAAVRRDASGWIVRRDLRSVSAHKGR